MLADNRKLGEPDNIRPGLRRMKRGRHVVFYRQDDGGILVSRMSTSACCPNDTRWTMNDGRRSVA
jgi:plasmid stabilization system protein ParE